MKLDVKLPEVLEKIVMAIKEEGGEPYLVGGAVIDFIRGGVPKDYDIEVFHLSYDNLLACMSGFGEPDLIGNKFGILKLKVDELDIELSIPRRDSKAGLKHKDFDIELVPDLKLEEAAQRRDFTINSISITLPDGTIHDPFNGIQDLEDGILRHVSNETFRDDPLRAFRGLQILARKLETTAPETIDFMKYMTSDCKNISEESILGELNKLLMMAPKPSIGLELMRESNLVDLFPELKALIGSEQNPKHHPEGDVWTHTMGVVDAAAQQKHNLPEEWQLPFMWGALLHDIGKPATLDEDLHNYGHDAIGSHIARKFMKKLKASKDLIEKVPIIVKSHMRAPNLTRQKSSMKAWRKLQNFCPLNICGYIALCDAYGCDAEDKRLGGERTLKRTLQVFQQLGKPAGKIEGILKGRHLIELGHLPSTKFGPMLERAYNYQIKTGCTDIEQLLKAAGAKKLLNREQK
jgi:tRNA nucleotidyltransferase (CCA-adding enzyme)